MSKKKCNCKCSRSHYTLDDAKRDLTEKYGREPSKQEIDKYYNYMNSD